jgi:hypothetical protein
MAVHRIPGTLKGDGAASKATSLGNNLLAVLPRVTNQGGVGTLRNGPRSTDFCGRENIKITSELLHKIPQMVAALRKILNIAA